MHKLIIETPQKTPSIFIKSPILNTINLSTQQTIIAPYTEQFTTKVISNVIQQLRGCVHLMRNLNIPAQSVALKQKSCALLVLNVNYHGYIQQLLEDQLTQIQHIWKIKQEITIPTKATIGCNYHCMVIFKSIMLAQEFYKFVESKIKDCIVFYVENVTVGVVDQLGLVGDWGRVLGEEEKELWVEIPHCEKCLEILQSEVTGIPQKSTKNLKQQIQMTPSCPACKVCWIRQTKNTQCSGCEQIQDNWVCMVCGIIGCGRYKNADAFKHYCTSKHILSLDLKTNHIWNYKLDCFSHRIVGRDGIMEENSRDIKFDMDFDDDRVEIQFWKYCNVVSEQLDRQRNFYNRIKEEQIQRYSLEQKILEDKLQVLNKMRQEKKENLKKKVKKNKKLSKRFNQLQEECKQGRQLNKILEESVKNKDKYEKKESQMILKKKQELRRLEEQIEKVLVSLESS